MSRSSKLALLVGASLLARSVRSLNRRSREAWIATSLTLPVRAKTSTSAYDLMPSMITTASFIVFNFKRHTSATAPAPYFSRSSSMTFAVFFSSGSRPRLRVSSRMTSPMTIRLKPLRLERLAAVDFPAPGIPVIAIISIVRASLSVFAAITTTRMAPRPCHRKIGAEEQARVEREILRAFLAFEVSPEVRESLMKAEEELTRDPRRHQAGGEENLHFTVKFLGEIPESTVDEIDRRVRTLALQKMEVDVQGLGAFPDDRHPRVVWAGVAPQDFDVVSKSAQEVIRRPGGIGESDEQGVSPSHHSSARPFPEEPPTARGCVRSELQQGNWEDADHHVEAKVEHPHSSAEQSTGT